MWASRVLLSSLLNSPVKNQTTPSLPVVQTAPYTHWSSGLVVWGLDGQLCGVQLIRSNVEWQRWEGADKWHWEACKRQLWADNLWRSHHQRRLQRGRLKEYLAMQQERERWVVPCQFAATSNRSHTCL